MIVHKIRLKVLFLNNKKDIKNLLAIRKQYFESLASNYLQIIFVNVSSFKWSKQNNSTQFGRAKICFDYTKMVRYQ